MGKGPTTVLTLGITTESNVSLFVTNASTFAFDWPQCDERAIYVRVVKLALTLKVLIFNEIFHFPFLELSIFRDFRMKTPSWSINNIKPGLTARMVAKANIFVSCRIMVNWLVNGITTFENFFFVFFYFCCYCFKLKDKRWINRRDMTKKLILK